jgi:hypothetical protein
VRMIMREAASLTAGMIVGLAGTLATGQIVRSRSSRSARSPYAGGCCRQRHRLPLGLRACPRTARRDRPMVALRDE